MPKTNKVKGTPIPILRTTDGRRYELDEAALKKILLAENVIDKNVVVISVAGDYRKGKSFLLGYFLRYLKYKYSTEEGASADPASPSMAWMGKADEPLEGFSWKYGSKRHTLGIWVWSEVFITNRDKEKVGIILLDTQGSFDTESSFKNSATIFSLSTMMSSCQCYNVSKNIQENDIHNLQFFTEYGKLVMGDNSGKTPFQKLVFIVRDWQFPHEASYGESGGRKILDERLKIRTGLPDEHEMVRKTIRNCFSDISCFLLPYPGDAITNPHYNGNVAGLAPDFQLHLGQLVPWVLGPKSLVVKEIGGIRMKARDLYGFFSLYVKELGSEKVPDPHSLWATTAMAQNLAALSEAKDLYITLMMQRLYENGNRQTYIRPNELAEAHARCKDTAIDQFDKMKRMGGEAYTVKYKTILEEEIEKCLVQMKKINSKQAYPIWSKPAMYAGIVLSFYFLTGILSRIGSQKFFPELQYLIFKLSVLGIITWSYNHYRDWGPR
uniref:Atlastin-1 n=1 Tax=Lygus hesperus TaxID=30085 RepID=A0A0A9WJC7_LYGHE